MAIWNRSRAGTPKTPKASQPKRADAKLGTFLGVFTPTVLTILGVIMYLRIGWVVGQVGLLQTLVIVVLSNSITFITTLSFSSVATNLRVGVGGAYFIISRSLGLEIGGAIGLPLFLSQAFSVTLYCFGLAESLRIIWPDVPLIPVSVLLIICVGLLAFRGAEMALRAQVPLMMFIALSLLALGAGVVLQPARAFSAATGIGAATGEHSFFDVLAVFFPAVTGVMAGLGLSGDLKDPQRAIPLGSIAATLTGFLVYLGVPVLLAMGADGDSLRSDPLVWTRIAPLGALLVLPGLWGAIFSSAVGSMLNAPRTLQALSLDHLAPRRLAGKRNEGEPILGLIATLALAMAATFLGNLNSVATVVTMFFLTVYGMVNLVAALESLSGDTSWRPKIKVPWVVSLLGAFGCFGVMFLINVPASLAAISIELFLWLLLARRERRANWGDARRGVYESLIRWTLLQLRRRPMTARNWRPHVLIFVERIERRLELVRFGAWFSQDRGVVTVCELMLGDVIDSEVRPQERRNDIERQLDREGISAFGAVGVVRSVEEGIIDVAQAHGFAEMDSNTVLLGWPADTARLAAFLRVTRRLDLLNKSVLIGRTQPRVIPREGKQRVIDIWWGGLQRNGDLMLLLAHLLTRNPAWRTGRVRVMSVASSELAKAESERTLAALLPEMRMHAEVRVLVKPKEATVHEIIHAESGTSDVVFLGLAIPAAGDEEPYAQRLLSLAEGLGTFFFVKNSTLFVGELGSLALGNGEPSEEAAAGG